MSVPRCEACEKAKTCLYFRDFGGGRLAEICNGYAKRVELCGDVTIHARYGDVHCDRAKGHSGLHGGSKPSVDLVLLEWPILAPFDKAWEKHEQFLSYTWPSTEAQFSRDRHMVDYKAGWQARGKADVEVSQSLPCDRQLYIKDLYGHHVPAYGYLYKSIAEQAMRNLDTEE